MDQRTCMLCGAGFLAPRRRGRKPHFCSPVCRQTHKRQQEKLRPKPADQRQNRAYLHKKHPCSVCGLPMWKSTLPEGKAAHRRCKPPVEPTRRRRARNEPVDYTFQCLNCGVTGQRVPKGSPPRWCSACKHLRIRRCTACGELKPSWSKAKECRDCAGQRRQQAEAEKASRKKGTDLVWVPNPVRPTRTIAAPKPAKPRRWVSGPCGWCTENFVIRDQIAARYCSTRCGRNAAKSKHERFLIPPPIRYAIYKRDNWTCQLCNQPVDRKADPKSRLAPTLDHIECQSWALIPDHSPRNLRLAHRICNALRGDETWSRVLAN